MMEVILMTVVTVGQFKSRFSYFLKKIEQGEPEIVISYGKSKRKVAALVPFAKIKNSKKKHRPLGLGLRKKGAGFRIMPDFKMTEEELLDS